MKDIAEYLSITPPSATTLIENLVEAGYLHRAEDGKDRRIVRLVITSKGKDMLEKRRKKMLSSTKKILLCLNQKERISLIKIFEKIINNYQK